MKEDMESLEKIAEVLKVMAHPVRLKIIKNLMETGPSNVGKMQEKFDIPQPTVSSHLGKLKRAGVLKSERRGTEIFYKVDDEMIISLAKVLFK